MTCIFSNNILVSLIPLTLDRFVAVCFATRYSLMATKKRSTVIILTSWVPSLLAAAHTAVGYATDSNVLEYHEDIGRCSSDASALENKVYAAVFFICPIVIICCLYGAVIHFVLKTHIPCRRMLLSSSAIIFSGLVPAIPIVLIEFGIINLPKEMLMVLSVTFVYLSSICNPIIYFCCNPRVRDQVYDCKKSRNRTPSGISRREVSSQM